jgi:hypothetical protein
VGLEYGFRWTAHPICTGLVAPLSCAPQPEQIERGVLGIDASGRVPQILSKDLFGDKPTTIDYSYRMRRLAKDEPFANEIYAAYNLNELVEGQSKGGRSYQRITFVAPISAYVQIRSTWQHGSLPPLFQYVDNQVTFGLTYSNPGSSEH